MIRYMDGSLVWKLTVVVSGFDCGQFWKVQSLSTVIWTGGVTSTSPSITPKYGASLQKSPASAAETAYSVKTTNTHIAPSAFKAAPPRPALFFHLAFDNNTVSFLRQAPKRLSLLRLLPSG